MKILLSLLLSMPLFSFAQQSYPVYPPSYPSRPVIVPSYPESKSLPTTQNIPSKSGESNFKTTLKTKWPSTLEDQDVPSLLQKSELLTDFFKNYIQKTIVPKKEDLRVKDKNSKFSCTVTKLDNNALELNQESFNANFSSLSGGLNGIELRITDSGRAIGANYVLVLKDDRGWRGVTKRPKKSVRILDEITQLDMSTRKILVALDGDWYAEEGIKVKRGNMNIHDTLCIRANKTEDAIKELVIEMGEKYTGELIDAKDVLRDVDHSIFLASPRFPSGYPHPAMYANKPFSSILERGFSIYAPDNRIYSPCWADLEKNSQVRYKMTALGTCQLDAKE